MKDYAGFSVKTTVTDEGITTTFIINKKEYSAEQLIKTLDEIEPYIREIEKKSDEIDEKYRNEIEELLLGYHKTGNPIDKIRLAHRLVEIGANIPTIAGNIGDIKNKLEVG